MDLREYLMEQATFCLSLAKKAKDPVLIEGLAMIADGYQERSRNADANEGSDRSAGIQHER